MTDVLRQVSTLDEKTFPTISRLPRKERVCIWAHVSSHIERQMTSQKGVHLAGLGTFTFSQQRLDTGLQKPIFLLSGTLIKSLGLRNDRPLAVGPCCAEKVFPSPSRGSESCPAGRTRCKWSSTQAFVWTDDSRSPQIPQSSPQEGSKTKSFTRTTCAELELCGVCLQRSKRNVPVYEREQKLAEEKHQEKVLLLRAQQEARLHLEKEQAKRKERRLQAQKDAVLNLQMSEKDQTCSSLDGTSFLFLTRPLTPPRKVKQQQYMSALQHQVESRRQQEALELRESRLTEHQNQIQQAQRNLELKSRQLQEKMEKRRSYKAALDSQVKDRKCTTHVEVQPEAFRSRRCETPVVNAERREAAQQLFWTNSSAATQRKREEVQRHRAELEREKQMLQQNQKEFVLDHRINVERRKAIRKSLESEWRQSAQMKHQREEKEMDFLRSATQSLVEKLVQQKRCQQCKRRTSNCGETNIWRDSNYASGSQFMT
ncbi:coiled-coil domain-containing protein 81-like isoform 3-T4 [Synchiropus picturatus]